MRAVLLIVLCWWSCAVFAAGIERNDAGGYTALVQGQSLADVLARIEQLSAVRFSLTGRVDLQRRVEVAVQAVDLEHLLEAVLSEESFLLLWGKDPRSGQRRIERVSLLGPAIQPLHSPPATPLPRLPQRGLELKRDASGHYRVRGRINGREVAMLVDTGATRVALPESLARRLGLRRGARVAVSTAAGVVHGWQAQLASVEVADLRRRNVPALIMPGMRGEVLLGMSFLSHYALEQRAGRLTIKPDR